MILIKLTRRDRRMILKALKLRLKDVRDDLYFAQLRMDYSLARTAVTHAEDGAKLDKLLKEEHDILERIYVVKRYRYVEE